MKAKAAIIVSGSVLLICVFFSFLYVYDNKYMMSGPYGNKGIINIQDQDFESNKLIFLIDDWEFYKNTSMSDFSQGNTLKPKYVFIGQYPNFSLMKGVHFTHATYRMVVNHKTTFQELFFKVPEIFTDYTIYIDGIAQSVKTGDIVSLGKSKESVICIQVHKSNHYYDGMYYPPAIGSLQALQRMSMANFIIYAFMSMFAFVSFLFSITLRKKDADHIFSIFSMMCLSFSLFCLYPFLHALSPTYSNLLYRYEDVTNFLMIAFLLNLTARLSNLDKHKMYRKGLFPMSIFIIISSIFIPSLLLPIHKEFINTYGFLIDLYKWLSSIYLFYCAIYAFKSKNIYAVAILAGGSIFATSQLFNFFFNNLFEPIYGCWQSEYAGFFIMLIFFYIVLKRNQIILNENITINEHLEKAIQERTKDIYHLLEERKAFFSNVAHDLKAPLGAIQNYTQLIEQNNLHLDEEIQSYIMSIKRKNKQMSQRISSLQQLTQLDKTQGESTNVSINNMLQLFYDENIPEADALGIHFTLTLLDKDCEVYGQEEKLSIVFENLFYNALSFTTMNGHIHIVATRDDRFVTICVEDTGVGISEEDLPHIFERFYSKRANEHEKSGLGLYIVSSILMEMHGSIHVHSQIGKGTMFTIQIPIISSILKKEENHILL